jgi:hypothetical protein
MREEACLMTARVQICSAGSAWYQTFYCSVNCYFAAACARYVLHDAHCVCSCTLSWSTHDIVILLCMEVAAAVKNHGRL